MRLTVSEVFSSFQGEGPNAGRPAAFLRLAGCNLNCAWCDTPYTWDWGRFDEMAETTRIDVEDVAAQLAAFNVRHLVVTGGEPLLQPNGLTDLLERLGWGWTVEVETNGTVPLRESLERVDALNVSVKLANSEIPADVRIRPKAITSLRDSGLAVWKFVAASPADLDEIADLTARFDLAPVWVMPEGSDRETHMANLTTLAPAILARGWNVAVRLHTLLWNGERGR